MPIFTNAITELYKRRGQEVPDFSLQGTLDKATAGSGAGQTKLPSGIEVDFSKINFGPKDNRQTKILPGAFISKGERDPVEQFRQDIRDIPIIGKLAWGKGFNELYPEGTLPGFLEEKGALGFLFEGFNEKINPTRAEIGRRIDDRVSKLTAQGIPTERALNAAVQDVIENTPGNAQNIQDLYNPDIKLTDEEKEILTWTNRLEDVFATLDAPITFGTTKPATVSLKSLERLKGATTKPTVLRETIENILNQPDIKQVEKDLVRSVIDEVSGDAKELNVQEVIDQVNSRLLPLDEINTIEHGSSLFENVSLSDELRGNVANYNERIYQSPIPNSAGNVHFSDDVDRYFAHTRIEDMADDSTRRVIEVQSDLFQKGRLEGEGLTPREASPTRLLENATDQEASQWQSFRERNNRGELSDAEKSEWEKLENRLFEKSSQSRDTELSQLQPYRNTWWERIVREEVKKAAIDGKKTLQFPTGETAMKIEGLGEDVANNPWRSASMERHLTDPDGVKYSSMNKPLSEMKDDLYVGMPVKRAGDEWIITEVLDDGKFKAVPKSKYEQLKELDKRDFGKNATDEFAERQIKAQMEASTEQFDISGKIDTNNPIYRFYEKEVGRYLKNRFDAKVVTDEQGVKWHQLNVDKIFAEKPVEAFAGAVVGIEEDDEGNLTIDPLTAGLGAVGLTGARKLSKADKKLSSETLLGGMDPKNPSYKEVYMMPRVNVIKKAWTNVVEYIQNTEERLRQLREPNSLDDAKNPYQKMALYFGKVQTQIQSGYDQIEDIAKDVVSITGRERNAVEGGRETINKYLQALHAPERNAALGDGAAGITTEEAQAIVAETPAEIKAIGEKALALNRKSLDLLRDSGVISDELHTALREKYKNHVPLQRILPEDDDVGSILSGRGFDVRSTGIKTAKGSDLEVSDILANITNNYEQAVLRSEKNIADQATLAFVREEIGAPQALSKTPEEGFLNSSGHVSLAKKGDTTFDIGTFGKNALTRKVDQADRLNPNLIPESIDNIKEVYRGSNDANSFRYNNKVWISKVGDEFRAVVTRKNPSGNEEIINFFKIGRDKDTFISNLGDSVPSQTRTGTSNLEGSRSILLTNRDVSSILNDIEDVNVGDGELSHLFEVTGPKVIGQGANDIPIFERTNDPTILQMYERGKPVWIKIKDENLAEAMRGVSSEKLGPFLRFVASFTRLYSGLATRFNVEFALSNKIRDLQETLTYAASQENLGARGAAKILKNDPASMKAVLDGIRGVDSPGARFYNEMKSYGGTTGGLGLSTREQTELNIDKIFATARSRPRRAAQKLIEYVDHWNTIFEDSTRLSVYKSALENGATNERAAFLAKEASINFNRRGKGGPVIQAFWMFSNPSIQGTFKMLRAMKNPKVAAGTSIAIASSVAAVSEWNDRVNPNWRNEVSEWDRNSNLPIMLPTEDGEGVRYVVIPISWGLKPLLVAANTGYDVFSGQEVDLTKQTMQIFSSFLDAVNPVGGTDLLSAAVPSILDVPVDIARNKKWSGSKIRPDYDPDAPKDIQYFPSLGDTAFGRAEIAATRKLADTVGLLLSPADLDYALKSYMSGAGRSITKTANLIYGIVDPETETPPADEWPFVSRFLRQRDQVETGQGAGGRIEKLKEIKSERSRENFLLKEEARGTLAELQTLPPEVARNRFDVLIETNPQLAQKVNDLIEGQRLGRTYEEELIVDLTVGDGERARYIYGRLNELKTDEQKGKLWQEYVDKKIITDKVAQQIKDLINQ